MVEGDVWSIRDTPLLVRCEHDSGGYACRVLLVDSDNVGDATSLPWWRSALSHERVLELALVPPLIREGGYLWKVPGHNVTTAARRRWFRLAPHRPRNGPPEETVAVTWCDPRALRASLSSPQHGFPPEPKVRSLALADVVELRPGHATPAWWSQASARKALPVEDLCWSLVSRDNKTLDLAAETVQEARLWKEALAAILRELGGPRQTSSAQPTTANPVALRLKRAVAEGRRDEVASLLASRQIETDAALDESGDTALLLACRLGRAACAEVALAHGARNDPHPTWGGTALQLAVAGGHVDAAAALLGAAAASGADRSIANHVILESDDAGALRQGDAPLHVAARLLAPRLVQLLLEHHADPVARDGYGRTPAHVAIASSHDRALDVLALLLDGGGEAAIDARDSAGGETPLHVAARCAGQEKRAKFPTSKAPISAVFHSFRLIFGRAIISRNGLEAWMLFPERARAEHSC